MAGNNEDFLKKPLYVYGLPGRVLETLTVKDTDTESALEPSTPATPTSTTTQDSSDTTTGSQSCSLCSLTFTTHIDQRIHIKSDLHHYNLKRSLRGQKAVSEGEFEALVEELDESLSGSDDDSSEEDEAKGDSTLTSLLRKQARIAEQKQDDDEEEDGLKAVKRRNKGKPPLIWFSSSALPDQHYFGVYRAIFTSSELRPPPSSSSPDFPALIRSKQIEPIKPPKVNKDGTPSSEPYKGPHIFLCMIGGGHFAAMVVSLAPRHVTGSTSMNREATVLAHKTFHRYTTRRKQGGSQGLNDNAKGPAQSVGSSLRRYNEEALRKDIRALLSDWKGLIDTSELLFVRATGSTNRGTLFGPYEGQVLRHNDERLRGFPFSTRRATQNELMRSFIELTRLKVREIVPEEPEPQTVPTKTSSPKPTKPKLTEEEETALLHTSQLQAFMRRSKLPALLAYFKNNNLPPDFEFHPPEQNHHAPRPLHLAASQNSAPLVLGLIVRGGANPTLANKEGKAPFELAGDRPTRDAFRVARHEMGETAFSWDAAHVPPALAKADADARDAREKADADAKEAERRKAEEKRLEKEGPKVTEKRGAGRALRDVVGEKTAQEKREEETRGLSGDMRAKLERERRARAAEARMKAMRG